LLSFFWSCRDLSFNSLTGGIPESMKKLNLSKMYAKEIPWTRCLIISSFCHSVKKYTGWFSYWFVLFRFLTGNMLNRTVPSWVRHTIEDKAYVMALCSLLGWVVFPFVDCLNKILICLFETKNVAGIYHIIILKFHMMVRGKEKESWTCNNGNFIFFFLIFLLQEYYFLWNPSFWLSFASIACMLFLLKQWTKQVW